MADIDDINEAYETFRAPWPYCPRTPIVAPEQPVRHIPTLPSPGLPDTEEGGPD